MATKKSETIATHDAKGNLTGSLATAGKIVPTANPVASKLVPKNLTRAEGYKLGRAKEAEGIVMAQSFLGFILGVPVSSISKIYGKEENYTKGDLTLPSGNTIEVKRQPIGKYGYNFIELGEITTKELHRGGQSKLGKILGIPEIDLESTFLIDKRKVKPWLAQTQLGKQEYFSLSILSIANSHATIYVNPKDGFLYIYRRAEIIDKIRNAVRGRGVSRGMGNSNEDTISVVADNPIWKYKREIDAQGKITWRYIGQNFIYSKDGLTRRNPVEVLKEYLAE